MNSIEIIKDICKKRKIPISKLEKDCGFGNGYISKAAGGITSDRLKVISEYLDVSTGFLLTGKEEEPRDTLGPKQLLLYEKMLNLSPEQLDQALQFVDYLIHQQN